jgi:hypothetical protein
MGAWLISDGIALLSLCNTSSKLAETRLLRQADFDSDLIAKQYCKNFNVRFESLLSENNQQLVTFLFDNDQ